MDFFEFFSIERKDEFVPLLKSAEEMCEKYGDMIFDFERHGIFTYTVPHIAVLAAEAKKEKADRLYCYFLAQVLATRDRELVAAASRPKKKGVSEKYDFLPMFGLLWHIDGMVEGLRSRGVDEDVVSSTKKMFENQLGDFIILNHRYGISDYVGWLEGFLENRLVRIGRFNFERRRLGGRFYILKRGSDLVPAPDGVKFHRSGRVFGSVGCDDGERAFTATFSEDVEAYLVYEIENGLCKNTVSRLPKNEWEIFLTPDSDVIDVHIPTGGPLEFERDSADLKRGFELINRCFGGSYKAFHMHSWLLEPELPRLMGKVTELTRFCGRFTLYPSKSDGKDVFEYLYELAEVPPLEQLEEKTSLQRSVKKYLMDGNHFYGGHGVMPPDKLFSE